MSEDKDLEKQIFLAGARKKGIDAYDKAFIFLQIFKAISSWLLSVGSLVALVWIFAFRNLPPENAQILFLSLGGSALFGAKSAGDPIKK